MYGGYLGYACLPMVVWGIFLEGGSFAELDIRNICYSILYAELIEMSARDAVASRFPCIHSNVGNREGWIIGITDYYGCYRAGAIKISFWRLIPGGLRRRAS